MVGNLSEQLKIDKDLICEFLLYFSRFEYALKRTNYVCGNEREARPAWDRFSDDLIGRFSSITDSEFIDAVKLLDSEPPSRQVLRNGELGWEENRKNESESHEKWILRLVRAVRNNLFHGGKYPGTVISPPERNPRLLEACLTVLRQVLELSPEVKRCFDSNDDKE